MHPDALFQHARCDQRSTCIFRARHRRRTPAAATTTSRSVALPFLPLPGVFALRSATGFPVRHLLLLLGIIALPHLTPPTAAAAAAAEITAEQLDAAGIATAVVTAAAHSNGSSPTAPAATPSSDSGNSLPPLWGCESPSLEQGAMHVVVSTYNADPEQLLPWLWHLGLTNAAVYVYYRVDTSYIPRQYHGTVQLPCNMSLHVLPLLPNKGREGAVFLHHIVMHYDNLPLAILMAHDHGPASRHSLCGPFYRRARAYYRGLWELAEEKAGSVSASSVVDVDSGAGAGDDAAEVDIPADDVGEGRGGGGGDGGEQALGEAEQAQAQRGEGLEQQRGQQGAGQGGLRRLLRGGPKRSSFARLATMVVTLSSGCVETWARGCCSAFICSSSKRSCPFGDSDNCTRAEASRRGGYRHVFMHQYGLYDIRYENQVLGPEGTARPVALLRYTSGAHRFASMWNISHEYPPDEKRRSREETMELLRALLERYEFSKKRRSTFKSCCASLIVQRKALLRWPLQFYQELLAYAMDPSMDYEATKAISGPAWGLWLDKDYTPQDTMTYLRVDFALKHMQGCPAQYTSYMQNLVKVMRAHAEGAPEGGVN